MRAPAPPATIARPDWLKRGAWAAGALWILAVAVWAASFHASPEPQPFAGLAALLFAMTAAAPVGLLAAAVALLRRAERIAAAPPAATAPGADETSARLRALTERIARLEAQIAGLKTALEKAAPAATGRAEPFPTATPQPASPPRRAAPAASPANEPALPFAEAAPGGAPRPPSWDDVVRALDFPRDDRDAAGFAALQAAVRDPEAAQLLQAAEDVLTMLAADGLHMEDIAPVPASLDAWAAYAEGARGAAAAAIGGVHDAAALDLVRARLKRDAIFRDAGLVLARRWGAFVQRAFRELGRDPVLLRIADTRSARAFMLVARAMGAFG